jgi:hypothetical protein
MHVVPFWHVEPPEPLGTQPVLQQSAPVLHAPPTPMHPLPGWHTNVPVMSCSQRPEQHSLGAAQRVPASEHAPAVVVQNPRREHSPLQHCALDVHAAPMPPSVLGLSTHARTGSLQLPTRHVEGSLGQLTAVPAPHPSDALQTSDPLQ